MRWMAAAGLAASLAFCLNAFGNPIQQENLLGGTEAWTAPIAGGAIEGYTSETSVAPGQVLHLHVSLSSSGSYRVEIYRLGWYGGLGGRLVACEPDCGGAKPGMRQPSPAVDLATGRASAAWPTTDEVNIRSTWVSGYYVAKLIRVDSNVAVDLPFIVRQAVDASPSMALVIVPVNTWEAYNPWGGKSLYGINSTNGLAAVKVSFDRPLAVDRPTYPAARNSFLTWELPLARFLERSGIDISYETDVDVDSDPGSLLRHRLVIVAGHSEYWTSRIRGAYGDALARGTNLAFVGANDGYWRIRYEDDRRTIVAYKEQAAADPDTVSATTLFRSLDPPMPACQLLGVEHQPPGGRPTTQDPDPTIALAEGMASDPWFVGTGFTEGSALHGLLGYEWDAAVPGCTPANATVLFRGGGDAPSDYTAVRFRAPSGGTVFSAGSLQFAWGLDDFGHGRADPRLAVFLSNALEAMSHPAAVQALDARATPDGVRLYAKLPAGDPRVRTSYLRSQVSANPPSRSAWSRVVCASRVSSTCVDRPPGHRTYEYSAVISDAWSTSAPIQATTPVAVPNRPPEVEVYCRKSAGRFYLTARGTDPDGDHVSLAWRINGRLVARAAGTSIVVKEKGLTVTVVGTDSLGGRASSTLRLP